MRKLATSGLRRRALAPPITDYLEEGRVVSKATRTRLLCVVAEAKATGVEPRCTKRCTADCFCTAMMRSGKITSCVETLATFVKRLNAEQPLA